MSSFPIILNSQQYIKSMASPESIERGEKLFENHKVTESKYNPNTGVFTFEVLGTRPYTVKIWSNNNKIVTTQCNCPYDFGGICKHTVAAIFSMHHNGQKSRLDIIVRMKILNLPGLYFPINDPKNVLTTLNRVRYRSYSPYFVSKPWFLRPSQHSWTFIFTENEQYVIDAIMHDDKIWIKGRDYRNQTDMLTDQEVNLLMCIAESKKPDLLHLLFHHNLAVEQKNLMEDYGLENEDFNQYFQYLFDPQKGIRPIHRPEYLGIIPIKNDADDAVKRFLAEVEQLEAEALPKHKEEKLLAFVIDAYKHTKIIPIIGSPDKSGDKLSKLEYYTSQTKNQYKIQVSENQRNILDIYELTTHNATEHFNHRKKLYKLLAKEKFVYMREFGTQDLKKKNLEEVIISETEPQIVLKVEEDTKFLNANTKVFLNTNETEVKELYTYQIENGFIKEQNIIYPLPDYKSVYFLLEGALSYKMPKDLPHEFFQNFIQPVSQHFKIDFSQSPYEYESIAVDFSKKQVYLSENDHFLIIKPAVVYKEKAIFVSHRQQIMEKKEHKIIELIRNKDLENDFIQEIADLHEDFQAQAQNGEFQIDFNDFMKDRWFFKFFEQMQKHHVEIYGLKELKKFRYNPNKANINTQINSGQDWFDIQINISFGNQSIRIQDIKQAIVNNQNYVVLKDGSLGILPEEWIEKLQKYFRNGKIEQNQLKISKLKFGIIQELFENIDNVEILAEISRKKEALAQFKQIGSIQLPAEIKAELRPYQKEGFNWLHFLNQFGWGGILADDMGLGKTLQILTFMQSIVKISKKPSLIVVPTTLLFNWQKEKEKFAPKLKAFYHYGLNREQDTKNFGQYNLIFTTYGTLLRDVEFLKDYAFHYLILDESQAIKNPLSMRYKSVALLQAENRIALTGTPIENSTFDLFAQLSFVNRGMLGSINDFKTGYANEIDINRNREIAAELQKMINPFVLRRTKEQVAKELPPKVENIIYCEMGEEQRRIYDAYKNEYREKLLQKIEQEGLNKSKMMILEALTRLRQICDSPALLKDDQIPSKESIKIKEIINHITEKTAHHKILIFSQFVSMLDLIKQELEKINIAYEYLDGKNTVNERENSVNNFQQNNDLRVFLISLKAGGTGLNLNSADYVYIVDPWWNPAVENQAIDRTYRIGQDKHVFAYRMVCKDTIEEKMLKLQEKKKNVADEIIQTDENILKTINIDDLRSFLE